MAKKKLNNDDDKRHALDNLAYVCHVLDGLCTQGNITGETSDKLQAKLFLVHLFVLLTDTGCTQSVICEEE